MHPLFNRMTGGLSRGSKRISLFIYGIPIRYKLAIASVLAVLLPMALAGLYFYWSISSIVTNNANKNLDQLIRQTNENIESSLSAIDSTSFNVISNPTIRSFTIDGTSIDSNYDVFLLNKSRIESEFRYSLLFDNAWNSQLINTMYLFFNEENYVSISRSLANTNVVDRNNIRIFTKTDDSQDRAMQIIPPSPDDKTIYFVRNFHYLNDPAKFVKLVIGTDENEIYKKYEKVIDFTGAKGFIMDGSGIIYSHPQKDLLGTRVEPSLLALVNYDGIKEVTLENRPYYMVFKKIGSTPLTFVAGLPKDQVLLTLSTSLRNSLSIMFLILTICLIFSLVLSLKLTGFIKDLQVNLNRVKAGDYEAKLPEYSDLDLALVSTTFNNMSGEIKRLINQVYEEQLLLKETEIKFLQSQMNPHFLFNVLATIGWKARLSNDETVFKMVTSLSKLLRAGIYSEDQSRIPIRQELEYIEFYLYLQKVRFEDRFDYTINISGPEMLDYYLPRLSIEPIVENAVVHGVEKNIGKGNITINLDRDGDSIVFEIIDNGRGFDRDPDELLSQNQAATPDLSHNKIGLSNTNRRIKLVYGEGYGIHIRSEVDKGSVVTVRIPMDRGEGDHD
jgi:two-component system, sensor histidine kinase YesM